MVHLVIKRSRVHGLGLFAGEDLRAETKLGEYAGHRTTIEPADSDYVFRVTIYNKKGKMDHYEYIDAEHSSCPLRYVNGADASNSANVKSYQWKGRIYFKTLEPVHRGTELFVDYGDEYW